MNKNAYFIAVKFEANFALLIFWYPTRPPSCPTLHPPPPPPPHPLEIILEWILIKVKHCWCGL